MPALDVQLCSQALLLLGAGSINSFEEGTQKAQVAAALYPGVREMLLVDYPWRFTLVKAQLSQDTAAPINEWSYSYVLPGECMLLRQLFPSASVGESPLRDYEIFGRRVYADQDAIWADYQRDPGEESDPPHFRALLKYALASEFAITMTDMADKANMWRQVAFGTPQEGGAGGYSRKARQLDAQQQPGQILGDSELIMARFS